MRAVSTEKPPDAFQEWSSESTADGASPRRSGRLKKLLAAALLALIGLAVGGYLLLRGERLVIELTQQQLQEQLDARFPREKSYLGFLSLTLSDPQVELVEGSDRVTFGLTAVVNVRINGQPRPLSGSAVVTTGLRYEPGEYAFYLDDPVVDRVEIEGLSVEHLGPVNRLARGIAQEHINQTRVYKLDKQNLKHAATRAVLKGLVVKDGKLIITLGL